MKEKEIRPTKIFNEFLRLSKKDIKKYFKDKNRFEKIGCPACNSRNLKYAFNKNSFIYEECLNCKTLFVNPRPDFKAFKEYYTDSESVRYFAGHFYKATEKSRRKLIFKPRASKIKSILEKKYSKNFFEKYIDIGAGYGTQLEEMKKLKIFQEIYALEPALELKKELEEKGFTVINKSLENIDKKFNNYFKIATCFELLEHIQNPKKFLKKIYKILKKKGCLILTTLNSQGYDLLILGKNSKSISPPHHINFFNPESLEILLKKIGFCKVEIFTPGKIDVDIVKNYINEKKITLDDFTMKLANSDSRIRQNFQKFLIKNNLSSHMWAIAEK